MIKTIIALILITQVASAQLFTSIPRIDNTPKLFLNHGNSIAKGKADVIDVTQNDPGTLTYQMLLNERYAKNWTWYNRAQGGTTISDNISTISTRLIPYYDDNDWSIIVVSEYEGTNTIAASGNGYTAFSQMMQYKDSVLNSDDRTHLIIYMCVSCTPSYLEDTARQSYNTLLAGVTETSRLKIVSIYEDEVFDSEDGYLNSTYYGADGIHLTDAGNLRLATLGYNKLKLFFQ